MKEWTKKDFEIDSAKRVIEEDKQTKQHELDKDNKEVDRMHIEKAIEILTQKEK